jgi:hypothetical protein
MPSGRCPKCDGSMADGFIVDEGYGHYAVSTWHPGQPRKSIWTGIKRSKAEQLKISTRRCERCGYLESYAPAP